MITLAEMSQGTAISLATFVVILILCVVAGVFFAVDPNRRRKK